jgi:hypothetical protein
VYEYNILLLPMAARLGKNVFPTSPEPVKTPPAGFGRTLTEASFEQYEEANPAIVIIGFGFTVTTTRAVFVVEPSFTTQVYVVFAPGDTTGFGSEEVNPGGFDDHE